MQADFALKSILSYANVNANNNIYRESCSSGDSSWVSRMGKRKPRLEPRLVSLKTNTVLPAPPGLCCAHAANLGFIAFFSLFPVMLEAILTTERGQARGSALLSRHFAHTCDPSLSQHLMTLQHSSPAKTRTCFLADGLSPPNTTAVS